MERSRRLRVALAMYAALGLLIWTTIGDIQVPVANTRIGLRAATLAILALFVIRTLINWKVERIRAGDEER